MVRLAYKQMCEKKKRRQNTIKIYKLDKVRDGMNEAVILIDNKF